MHQRLQQDIQGTTNLSRPTVKQSRIEVKFMKASVLKDVCNEPSSDVRVANFWSTYNRKQTEILK
jgi:hypothetical protein